MPGSLVICCGCAYLDTLPASSMDARIVADYCSVMPIECAGQSNLGNFR